MITFEESIDLINNEIAKRKNKWRVYCAPEIDFEDISQILRIHIFTKWDQWDQSRPLANWLNRIISNQLTNLIRDNYGGIAPPCIKCSLNQGGNLCGFTKSGEQCSECPLYAKWEKSKKLAYDMKLAVSLDNDEQELGKRVRDVQYIDWPKVQARLADIMKKKLPSKIYLVYEMLYIKNYSDEQLSKALNLKTKEKDKVPGYKHIYNLKQKILVLVKKALNEEDLFI